MYFNESSQQKKSKIQQLIQRLRQYKNNETKNYFDNIISEVNQLIDEDNSQNDSNIEVNQELQKQSIYSDYNDDLFRDRYNKYKNNDKYTINNKYQILKESYNHMLQYQKYGFKFILSHYMKHKFEQGGCILADEAGLGKTIQAICSIQAIMSDFNQKMIGIIACPTSVVNQWVQEFRLWSPITRVLVISLQAANYNNLSSVNNLLSYLDRNPQILIGSILLMSQAILQQHALQIADLVNKYVPITILDEFHLYKNPNTLKTSSLKLIKNQFLLGLTGTPIQNDYYEIFNLFNLICPDVLGSKENFEKTYVKPIYQGAQSKASLSSINLAITQATNLMKLLATKMLRRYKSDVIKSLPQKSEFIVWCRVHQDVKLQYMKTKAYRDTFNDVLEYYVRLSKALINNSQIPITMDLKACFIVDKISELYNLKIDKTKIKYLRKDYQTKQSDNYLSNSIDNEEQEESEIVEYNSQIDISQPKCIIFCHNLFYIEIYSQILNQIPKIQYRVLTGATTSVERQRIITEFNYSKQVQILLSTGKVGGIGLNLTAANYVFLLQPHFNPAIDEQSIQRSYRIGQKREILLKKKLIMLLKQKQYYRKKLYKMHLNLQKDIKMINMKLEDVYGQLIGINLEYKQLRLNKVLIYLMKQIQNKLILILLVKNYCYKLSKILLAIFYEFFHFYLKLMKKNVSPNSNRGIKQKLQREASDLFTQSQMTQSQIVTTLQQKFPQFTPQQVQLFVNQMKQNKSSMIFNQTSSNSNSASQMSIISPNEKQQQPKLTNIKHVALPKNPITNYLNKNKKVENGEGKEQQSDQLTIEKLRIEVQRLKQENYVLMQKQSYDNQETQQQSIYNRCYMCLDQFQQWRSNIIQEFSQTIQFEKFQTQKTQKISCYETQIQNKIDQHQQKIDAAQFQIKKDEKAVIKYSLQLEQYQNKQKILRLQQELVDSFDKYRHNCSIIKYFKSLILKNTYKQFTLPTWYPIQPLQQTYALTTDNLIIPTTQPKFILLFQLGKGGFSTVFQAFDIQRCQFVALKISEYNVSGIKESQIEQRWKLLTREAIINQEISHKNIIQLIGKPIRINKNGQEEQEVKSQNKIIEIALEMTLCDEESLYDWCYRLTQWKENLTEQSLMYYQCWFLSAIIQIYDALKYLHNKNIIHNDISLQNVLRKGNQFLLCDFGFAKINEELKNQAQAQVTTLGGTLPYSAPERLIYSKVNTLSDIYSMGVLMAVAFTGQQQLFQQQYQDYMNYKNNIVQQSTQAPGSVTLSTEQINCANKLRKIFDQNTFQKTLPLIPEIQDLICQQLEFEWEKRPKASECVDRLDKILKKLIKKFK